MLFSDNYSAESNWPKITFEIFLCTVLIIFVDDKLRVATSCHFQKNSINFNNSLGAEDNIVAHNNKENERSRTTSTTIAEEAVDQLQASEKLIAGI